MKKQNIYIYMYVTSTRMNVRVFAHTREQLVFAPKKKKKRKKENWVTLKTRSSTVSENQRARKFIRTLNKS